MRKLKKIDGATTALMVAGAINWGLVGLAKYDVIGRSLGRKSTQARALYSLVGASALYKIGRAIAPKPRYEKRVKAFDSFMKKMDRYKVKDKEAIAKMAEKEMGKHKHSLAKKMKWAS